MAGSLKIVGMADFLGIRTVHYFEGRVSCGRCGRHLQISGRNGYTKRDQFAKSLKKMGWSNTRTHGWICQRCDKKVVRVQRIAKSRRC